MTMLRYAGQIALVVGAFWATLSVDADRGSKFLVDAAYGGVGAKDVVRWVLGEAPN